MISYSINYDFPADLYVALHYLCFLFGLILSEEKSPLNPTQAFIFVKPVSQPKTGIYVGQESQAIVQKCSITGTQPLFF